MKLYDTLTRTNKEIGQKHEGPKFKFYSCGPTVYNYAHIGNLRSFLFADTIRRSLEFTGTPVDWVMNITDVDDKTIKGAIAEFGTQASVSDLKTFTDKYLDIFLSELKELNIDTGSIRFIRVSDVIPQIQEYILDLINKGFAYQTEDGVFFSIEKYQTDFGDYGELVGKDFLEGKKVGARVKVDEYEKDNLSDFALWKKHTKDDGQIYWEHDMLSNGRPGWHIECSVINDIAFGRQPTDLHTGGVDLVFPHHTNEIAQSQPFYKPFSHAWAHSEHLQIDNKKMAKRDGNVYTLKDLSEKHPLNATAFRYLCLQTDFRKPMNFTWESLDAANTALERLYRQFDSLGIGDKPNRTDKTYEIYINIFKSAVEENLNLPKALAVVWELLVDSQVKDSIKRELLLQIDSVLGLNLEHHSPAIELEIPAEVQSLLDARTQARANKDFTKSDELRNQIETQGFEVIDTPEGQQIRAK